MLHYKPCVLGYFLAAFSSAGFAVSAYASSGSPTGYALQSSGTISFMPSATLSPGQDDLITFKFLPGIGTEFAPAEVTASNFLYSGNWQIDPVSLVLNSSTDLQGHYGYTLDSNNQVSTVSLYDNGTASTLNGVTASSPDDGIKTNTPTTSSISLPFSSIGTSASFTLDYYDPPATSTFELLEGNNILLAGTFDPQGNFTPTTTAAGVTETITPLAGTAVPEPSALALLALGALPVLGLARRRALR